MIAENLADVVFPTNQDIVRPISDPITTTGGVVGLRGPLAPEGAIVKVAGMTDLKFRRPARCFAPEEAAFDAVQKRQYKPGGVIVFRYDGPTGGPGIGAILAPSAAIYGSAE